jgi:hypothetical protein
MTMCPNAPVDAHQCIDYPAAMALQRAKTRDGDLACAGRLLDAIVTGRPADVTAIAERAYVHYLLGSNDEAELDLALGLLDDSTGDHRGLAAAIWYNKASLYGRRGDVELARVARVIAERFGSSAAKKELGSASRCTAIVDGVPDAPAPLAKTWHELAQQRFAWGKCDTQEPPVGEAASKKYACRPCLTPEQLGESDGGAWPGKYDDECEKNREGWSLDDCVGWGGPWDRFDMEKLPGRRFYFEGSTEADTRWTWSHRIDAGILMVETNAAKTFQVPGSEPFAARANDEAWGMTPEGDAGARCEIGGELSFHPRAVMCGNTGSGAGWGGGSEATVTPFAPSRRDYYDVATGKPLLRVVVWDGDPHRRLHTKEFKVVVHGETATLSGLGCDATVPIGGATVPKR